MKTIILLLLALGSLCPAFADTFTVTSNADSGPGTLREAITMANANGTAVADVINFNRNNNDFRNYFYKRSQSGYSEI